MSAQARAVRAPARVILPASSRLRGLPGAVLGKALGEQPGFAAAGVGRWAVCGSGCCRRRGRSVVLSSRGGGFLSRVAPGPALPLQDCSSLRLAAHARPHRLP
ncbi:hypothetical protein NN561_020096 [Cricetulus griseus]